MKIRQFMTYPGMREKKNNNKLHQEHVSYTKISTVNSKGNVPIWSFYKQKYFSNNPINIKVSL